MLLCMTTMTLDPVLIDLVASALRQILSLPDLTWLPLLRRLRSSLASADLDNATAEEMPLIAAALLDNLIHDAGILDVHRHRIV